MAHNSLQVRLSTAHTSECKEEKEDSEKKSVLKEAQNGDRRGQKCLPEIPNPGGLCSVHHPGSFCHHSTGGKIGASRSPVQQEQEHLVHLFSVCRYSGAKPHSCAHTHTDAHVCARTHSTKGRGSVRGTFYDGDSWPRHHPGFRIFVTAVVHRDPLTSDAQTQLKLDEQRSKSAGLLTGKDRACLCYVVYPCCPDPVSLPLA